MSNYAKVTDGLVVEVMVADPSFFDTFIDTSAGTWLQTSYNTEAGKHLLGGVPLRMNYAGVGYTYDDEADAFTAPQPYPSWLLNKELCTWEAPSLHPLDDKYYSWDEATKTWKETLDV